MELTIPVALGAAAGSSATGPLLPSQGARASVITSYFTRPRLSQGHFIAEGVRPGDWVAIWSPNTHHWVLGAFGALSAGATPVPVSSRFTGPEALDVISRSTLDVISRSGVSVLIVADRFLGTDRLAALRAAAEAQAAEIGARRRHC